MLRLAKKNRVLWVNGVGNRSPAATVRDLKRVIAKLRRFWRGCRSVAPNISVLTPLVIPFHGNPIARWINRHLYHASVLGTRQLVFKIRSPGLTRRDPRRNRTAIGEKLVVYHCVDDLSKCTGATKRELQLWNEG